MKILSIDPGDARTGLAVCDEGERLAFPVGTICEYNRTRLIERIALEAEKLGASHILVGNPINMNGTSGLRSAASQDLADDLRMKTGLSVTLWDERNTTVSANAILNNTNVRGAKRKKTVDAVAAVLLLESFLSFRKNIPKTNHASVVDEKS